MLCWLKIKMMYLTKSQWKNCLLEKGKTVNIQCKTPEGKSNEGGRQECLTLALKVDIYVVNAAAAAQKLLSISCQQLSPSLLKFAGMNSVVLCYCCFLSCYMLLTWHRRSPQNNMSSEFQGSCKNPGARLLSTDMTQSAVNCPTHGVHVKRDFNVTSYQSGRGQFCGSSFSALREGRVIPR